MSRLGTSPQRDFEQGAETAKLVEQQIGLCSLPATEAYLRAVGGRLGTVVDDPRWKFSFQIVDQAEPNAFAIPGGGIYVSRGLLALVNREDELADILQRLEQDVVSQGGSERKFSIFDSHPMTAKRMKEIQLCAGRLTPAASLPVAGDAAALFARIEPVRR